MGLGLDNREFKRERSKDRANRSVPKREGKREKEHVKAKDLMGDARSI